MHPPEEAGAEDRVHQHRTIPDTHISDRLLRLLEEEDGEDAAEASGLGGLLDCNNDAVEAVDVPWKDNGAEAADLFLQQWEETSLVQTGEAHCIERLCKAPVVPKWEDETYCVDDVHSVTETVEVEDELHDTNSNEEVDEAAVDELHWQPVSDMMGQVVVLAVASEEENSQEHWAETPSWEVLSVRPSWLSIDVLLMNIFDRSNGREGEWFFC